MDQDKQSFHAIINFSNSVKTNNKHVIPLPRYLVRSAFISDDFPTLGTPITITEKSFSSLRLYRSEEETSLATVGMIWKIQKPHYFHKHEGTLRSNVTLLWVV